MKVIIAGSRDYIDPDGKGIDTAVRYGACWQIDEVMSGAQQGWNGTRKTGADHYGEVWATANGIPIKRFPADWERHGKAAGPIRNLEMAQYADALIAIWDGKSRGTRHMIDAMRGLGKPVYIYGFNGYAGPGKVL